jgi:Subtilase family
LPALVGFTPAQIRHAYGFDKVFFQSGGQEIPGDGRGMTIALFEVGDTPGLIDDLHIFDSAFGLPDLTSWLPGYPQPTTPSLETIGVGGQLPPPGGSETEEILDVEWVHAVAPAASILVVEAADHSQLPQADALAAAQPGVVVVSNSYSTYDYLESPYELGDDVSFTTPVGHGGVTFLDSSGDTGAPSHPPSFSPNVISVGGTSLALDPAGNYGYETGWAGSGGGLSLYQPLPAFQRRAVSPGVNRREVPDVSIVGNPNTGVMVYDPLRGGWAVGGGTSLSAPLWAAIIAIADQGRAINGLGSLDGATQTLPDLYRLPKRDFHDITVGNNGFRAHRGYDLVTGLGSPYVDRVVAGLVSDTAVYSTTTLDKRLKPPASYYAASGNLVRGTAGSSFNGIIATIHREQIPGLARAVATYVNWGDGTQVNSPPIFVNPLGHGAFQVRSVLGSPGRKTYLFAGRYRITVGLTLPSGKIVMLHRTAVMAPAPLTVAGGEVTEFAGARSTMSVAAFTDSGTALPVGSYSAIVQWGDGAVSSGTITAQMSAPGFLVSGSHKYRKPGVKRITVTIERRSAWQGQLHPFVARSIAIVDRGQSSVRQPRRFD